MRRSRGHPLLPSRVLGERTVVAISSIKKGGRLTAPPSCDLTILLVWLEVERHVEASAEWLDETLHQIRSRRVGIRGSRLGEVGVQNSEFEVRVLVDQEVPPGVRYVQHINREV